MLWFDSKYPDMKPIADLFGATYSKPPKRARNTERGDLINWIAEKTKLPFKRVAFMTTGLVAKDLYFLRSDMEQANGRGVAYGAAFWHAIKPQKGYADHKKDFHRALENED